jgi:hypothetical protein
LMHFRLVEIVFLDFISTTETFAAFCGGCLSFFICFSSSKFRVTHKPKNKYDVGGNIPTCFPINQALKVKLHFINSTLEPKP